MLLGRDPERVTLDSLLKAMRGGRSGVLVLRGEPGAGKTALLEYTIESAAGLRIAQVSGVESEMELAFAALPVRVARPGWACDRGSVGCGAPGRPPHCPALPAVSSCG